MLLWASKFATAKLECSFEMGEWTPLGVPFILLAMVRTPAVLAYNWRHFASRARPVAPKRPSTPGSGGRDRIVVSTLRCGRNNPGSNPGHGKSPSFFI